MGTFWTSVNQEPKRAYRWYIGFENLSTNHGDLQYACKRVDRPSISVSETEHTYINHKFYYPGRVEWSEVSVSFVDVVGDDGAADVFLKALKDAGYVVPTGDAAASPLVTLGKKSLHDQMGDVYLYMVNADGDIHEKWILKNAFFKSVRLSGLDYGSDEMLTVDVSIRYDYANYIRESIGTSANSSGEATDISPLATDPGSDGLWSS